METRLLLDDAIDSIFLSMKPKRCLFCQKYYFQKHSNLNMDAISVDDKFMSQLFGNEIRYIRMPCLYIYISFVSCFHFHDRSNNISLRTGLLQNLKLNIASHILITLKAQTIIRCAINADHAYRQKLKKYI